MLTKADVIIVGAGIIGTSIGYFLAKKGKKVVIVEKEDIAAGASGACDSMVIMQSKIPGIHLEIALKSAELYRALAVDLDIDFEHRNCGGMVVIENELELKVMEDRVKKQIAGGLDVEILDIKEAKKKQPPLSEKLMGATYCANDAIVNPMKVTEAFAKEIVSLGGELYNDTEVTGILKANNDVKGVCTNRGQIESEIVVNAGGINAPEIGEMAGIEIDIQPRRGQLVVSEALPEFVSQITLSTKYLAAKHEPGILKDVNPRFKKLGVGLAMEQTKKGNLLFGATREYVGENSRVTREGIKEVIKNAVTIYPKLKTVHFIRTFAGLRPATPDGLPILGGVDGLNGFVIAAGHEGDGICLAPVTGDIISRFICGEKPEFDLNLFNLTRFNN